MAKTMKLITLLTLLIGFSMISLYAFNQRQLEALYLDTVPNQTFFGDNLYQSNRYAQKEVKTLHAFDSTIDAAFSLIGQSGDLSLYYDNQSYRFILKNEVTGYLWKSFADNLELEDLNSTMEALLTTPFYIEYYAYNNNTEKLATTTRREILSYVNVSHQTIPNGVRLEVTYNRLDIRFDLDVYLEANSLIAFVDQNSITEDKNLLSTIQILPNFGITRSDETPGYMIIPDGPGALYRLKDNTGKQANSYVSRYYGDDYGIKVDTTSNPLNKLSLPIFGMVHGIDQHAFLGIIEAGDGTANFSLTPSGANGLNFNMTGAQFILRESFVFPTNLKGDGLPSVIEEKYQTDLKIKYVFESNEQANYVGLANRYQQYLVHEGILDKQVSEHTTVGLDILNLDTKKGLFGLDKVVMTTFKETTTLIETLHEAGVDMTVTLKGWNKDGYSGQMPYSMDFDNSLGNTSGFNQLRDTLNDLDISHYLYGNYVNNYDHSSRVNQKDDYARGVYRRIISNEVNAMVYTKSYYINPETTSTLLEKDQAFYEKVGSTLALDLSDELFSYYKDGQYYDRNQSIKTYQAGLSNYDKVGLYSPNAYAFGYMKTYFDNPLFNAQYTFYDDTVPFLQTVLRGYIDMYAPYQNFYANSKEQILMLIDFGVYPAFIVTHEQTQLLKYTQANQYFSTTFETWAPSIKDTYEKVSGALDLVVGKQIIKKEVLETGIMKTTYEDGIYFVINYTDHDYSYLGETIPAKDLYVGGIT